MTFNLARSSSIFCWVGLGVEGGVGAVGGGGETLVVRSWTKSILSITWARGFSGGGCWWKSGVGLEMGLWKEVVGSLLLCFLGRTQEAENMIAL